VLKLSGEAFASDAADETIDGAVVERIAKEIAEVRSELGTEIAVVVGGGNIWRGATGSATGMDRASADYMGMLATVINALALQDALERQGQPTRVQTAIGMSQIAEPYIRLRAIRHLQKGRVVVFAAGTGNPFFTTDTAGALRAVEIEADVLLKGTHGGTDGVYDADPRLNLGANLLERVTFDEVIARELRAMDLTAITLCKENDLPIHVFSIMEPGNLRRALQGEQIGTLIR
jgi:uridylate kinase